MNREIKFRAWDKVLNQYLPNIQNHLGNDEWAFGNILKENGNRYIVEQYTGLKDKNGKDIYEFDICKFYNRYNETWYIRVVRYCPNFACFGLYPNMEVIWEYESDWLKISEVEVICNIYENP